MNRTCVICAVKPNYSVARTVSSVKSLRTFNLPVHTCRPGTNTTNWYCFDIYNILVCAWHSKFPYLHTCQVLCWLALSENFDQPHPSWRLLCSGNLDQGLLHWPLLQRKHLLSSIQFPQVSLESHIHTILPFRIEEQRRLPYITVNARTVTLSVNQDAYFLTLPLGW